MHSSSLAGMHVSFRTEPRVRPSARAAYLFFVSCHAAWIDDGWMERDLMEQNG